MIFEGSFLLKAGRQAVWEFLLDPARLAATLPGVEQVNQLDDQTFDGVIAATVGPISGKFSFRARIDESNPPSSMTAHMEGVDSVTKSTLTTEMAISLSEREPGETELSYKATIKVKGRLAILGDMVLRATARLMLDEFARRLGEQLDGRDVPAAS